MLVVGALQNLFKQEYFEMALKKRERIARVRGQGGFYTDKIVPVMQQVVPKGTFARVGGTTGLAFGGAVSGPLGAKVGKTAGQALGNKIAKILGFGDYTVQENTISNRGKAIMPGEAVPEFGVLGNETRVRHREYIGDIVVPSTPFAFNCTDYVINPGSTTTFPWLSNLAQQYQQYKFNGLIFEFKTMTSEVATGGPMGAVILATNYDVLEPKFSDKVHMENAQYSVSAKPSCSQIHTIECAPGERASRLLYIRNENSSTTVSQDARWADLGKFQIATAGLPGTAGQALGELWASYDVSLFKPEIARSLDTGTNISSGTLPSFDYYLGTNPTIAGRPWVHVTGRSIVFDTTGEFLLNLGAASTTGAAPTVTADCAYTLISANYTGRTDMLYRLNVTYAGQAFTLLFPNTMTLTASGVRLSRYTYSLG